MQASKTNPALQNAQNIHPQLPLKFAGPLLVVGGGSVDLECLKALAENGFSIVAADGGANHCAAAGLIPTAIIGDMDSRDKSKNWPPACKIFELLEQESTDFEKCLYATHSPFVLALGMTGKRLDHTLAAFEAAARYVVDRPIVFVDQEDMAIATSGLYEMHHAVKSRFSVHPLQSVKFEHSDGLLYPLDGLTLVPGQRTGTSNVTLDGPVKIVPAEGEQGAYMIILNAGAMDLVVDQMCEQ